MFAATMTAPLMRFFPARHERPICTGIIAPSRTSATMAIMPWSISMLAAIACHSSSFSDALSWSATSHMAPVTNSAAKAA
jgi:hypothetical protein